MRVKERILEFQKAIGLRDSDFERATHKSRGFWHRCTNPTSEYVEVVLDTFPELSAEWLLRGTGSMIKGDNTTKGDNYASEGFGAVEEYYRTIVRMKQERIDQLECELASIKTNIITA